MEDDDDFVVIGTVSTTGTTHKVIFDEEIVISGGAIGENSDGPQFLYDENEGIAQLQDTDGYICTIDVHQRAKGRREEMKGGEEDDENYQIQREGKQPFKCETERSPQNSPQPSSPGGVNARVDHMFALAKSFQLEAEGMALVINDQWLKSVVMEGKLDGVAAAVQHLCLKYSKALSNFFLEEGFRCFGNPKLSNEEIVKKCFTIMQIHSESVLGEDPCIRYQRHSDVYTASATDSASLTTVITRLQFLSDLCEFCRRKHRLLQSDPLDEIMKVLDHL